MGSRYIERITHFKGYLESYLNLPCYPCNFLKYFKKGDEEWGTPLSIPVSIDDRIENFDLVKVYPNPTNLYLNIELHELWKNPLIEIVNILGKIQQSVKVKLDEQTIAVDVSSFPKGMYFVVIIDNKIRHRIRFVVQ